MSNLERKELVRRINACDAEEKRLICSVIPAEILLDELQSRIHSMENIINGVIDALDQRGENHYGS